MLKLVPLLLSRAHAGPVGAHVGLNENPTLIAMQIQVKLSFLLNNHILETSQLFIFIFSNAKQNLMHTILKNKESFQDREGEER